jgi:hypothetical protein
MDRVDARKLTAEGRVLLRQMVVRLRKQSGMTCAQLAQVAGVLLDDANERGDHKKVDELEAERDAIHHEIKSNFDVRGRPRLLGSDYEKTRKRVSTAVRRGIELIEKRLPGLGAHLHESVSTGGYCVYRPSTPTSWRT